jgi:hypothetical protein
MTPKQRRQFNLERKAAWAKVIPARRSALRMARAWLKRLWSHTELYEEHLEKYQRQAEEAFVKGQSVEDFVVERGLFAQRNFDQLGKAIVMGLVIEFLER